MKLIKKLQTSLIILLTSFAPALVYAQPGCDSDGDGTPEICNPLAVDSVSELLRTLVDVITTLAVPVIVIMIIYIGFLFVTAGGNKDQIKDAREKALYVVIGAGIILGAQLITDILMNTAENIGVDRLNSS